MAIQLVNVGQIENDGTGDDLREAFVKVNNNFSELALLVTESTTVSNVGSGEGIYAGKEIYDLKFKSLVEGNSINLTSSTNEIVISVSEIVNKVNLTADIGSKVIEGTTNLSIIGESAISTEIDNDSLIIKTNFNKVEDDLLPVLGSNLNANNYSIFNLSSINGYNLDGLNKVVGNNFDFGNIQFQANNIIDWIIINNNVDMGTFAQPTPVSIDVGLL